MLFCLVLSDAMWRAFLVKVSSDMFVSELRKTIWEEKKNFFNENKIDADQLKLWKVNIPMKDRNLSTEIRAEDEDIREQLVDERQLSPLLYVGNYFKDEVDFSDQLPNDIRIVIQPDYATGQKRHAYPEPVELEPKRQKTFSETSENFDALVNQLFTELTIDPPPQLYPEFKQSIAGRFCKPGSCIPISGEKFPDMRLSDKNITDMGKKLVELCKDEKRAFQLLYAVSGAGKTRAIFDMAMHENGVFVTYIECRPSSGENSIILEPTLDRNFAQLVISIENEFVDRNIESARKEAKRLITREFTARVLYLIILSKEFEDLKPHDYLLAQIDRGQKSIEKIKDKLDEYDYSDLGFLFRSALEFLENNLFNKTGQKSLVFAIDEANVASTKVLNGQFLNQNKHPRGLLTPMLEILNLFDVSIVIAGTAFSLKQGSNIQSDIAKGQDAEYLVDFKFMKSEDVKAYITQYLDLSDCNIDIIENWKYLAGRPRLAARLVFEIICIEQELKTKTKQDVFKTAVDKTVHIVRKAMETHLEDVVNEAYGNKDISTKSLRDILEILFVNCWFFDGYVSKSEMDDESSKLVDCGIALLEKSNSKKYIMVNEPLAIETVNTVLISQYERPDYALLQNLIAELKRNAFCNEKSNTAKAITWQYFAEAGLMKFNNKTVAEFVKTIYNDEIFCVEKNTKKLKKTNLPAWTSNAIINIESYGNLNVFCWKFKEEFNDDVDIILKLLRKPANRKYMISPASVMRPDGIYIGNSISGIDDYWTLIISAKMYSSLLSGKAINKDKRTTNWDYIYYEDNENQTKEQRKTKPLKKHVLRKKFDIACEKYHHHGSLRIHFVLPGLANSSDNSDRGGCRVEGNDIIMYIDQTLLDKFFPKQYVYVINAIL